MTEDGLREYVEFGKRVLAISNPENIKRGLSETYQGTGMDEFSVSVLDAYNKCHLYKIDDATKKLLMMTRSPANNNLIRLPFKEMFLGCHFTLDEVEKFFGVTIEYDEIFGMILQEGVATGSFDDGKEVHELRLGNTLRVIACCQKGTYVDFQTIHLNVDYDADLDSKITIQKYSPAKNVRKFVKMFVMNVLNLIHDPEIELVNIERDDVQNRKRVSRGQVAIPSITSIRLTGRRKVYVDSLIASGRLDCGYRYFVAGSYRVLVSERYKDMRGKIIWVEPYERGEGILIQKDYEVKA
jgi:hypothetical protein